MNLRKKLGMLALCAMVLLSSFAFSACNKEVPVTIISVSGLESSVVVNGLYDTSNATAKVLLSNNQILDVQSDELGFFDLNTTTAGNKQLVVFYTYNDVTVRYTHNVEVYEDSVTEISIASGFEKSVRVGDDYDTSNIIIKLHYRSGKEENAENASVSFSAVDTSTQGIKTLTITYGTFTLEKDVYVYEADKVNAILKVEGLESSVRRGEVYSTDNAVATVIRTTGETFTVLASQLSFSEIDTTQSGNKTLTISYTEDGVTVQIQKAVNVYEDRVNAYEIVEGSYSPTLNMGQEFDASNLVLRLTLDTGYTLDVPARYLDLSQIDAYEEGDQILYIGYEYNGEQINAECQITVVKNYTIYGFVAPTLVTSYNQNSRIQNTYNSTSSDGVKGFHTTNNMYRVGNNNSFVFEPTLNLVYTGTTDPVSSTNYKATYLVYLGQSMEEEALLEGEDLADYVVIDELNHTLSFTSAAVDRVFTISVLPKFANSNELSKIYSTNFTFKVVDGYNVYNAKQLSVIDNVNAGGKWSKFKEDNGIDANLKINEVILHSDIEITDQDVPSIHFYQADEVAGAPDYERVLGSLKDRDIGYGSFPGNAENLPLSDSGVLGAIYRRAIAENSSFTISGNYFQLSAAHLSLIVRESGDSVSDANKAIVSHTTLLTVEASSQQYLSNAEFNLNDISLFGNANKTESYASSGGVMFLKSRNVISNITNNLSQSWYMSYMFRGPDSSYVSCYTDGDVTENKVLVNMNGVNAYDAYNTLLYLQGAGRVSIKDSILIGAGGPVMIVDHAKNRNSDVHTGRPCFVEVEDSVLESYIAGTEAWFVSMNATTLAGSIKNVDNLFAAIKSTLTSSISDLNSALDAYGLSNYKVNLQVKDKSILFKNKTMLNLIAVFKSDNTAGLEDEKTASSFVDVSKNGVANKFSTGFDLDERYDLVEQIPDLALLNIFKSFNGMFIVPNSEGTGLVYQNPTVTVDAQTAIATKIGAGDDSLLNQLIAELTYLVNTYNDAVTYFGAYLANNMGVILGLDG